MGPNRRMRYLGIGAVVSGLLFVSVLVSAGWRNTGTPSLLEKASWAAQILLSLPTAATILILVVQVADIRRSIRSEAIEATAARIAEISKLSLDHADEYEELHKHVTPSTRAELLAESYLDLLDTEMLRSQILGDDWQRRLPSLVPWIEDLFREMPGLVHVLEKRRNWYSAQILDIMKRATKTN